MAPRVTSHILVCDGRRISVYHRGMIRFRARFDGAVIIPLEPVNLPTGRTLELEVEVLDTANPLKGSPAAILNVMRQLPRVAAEDVDEMERLIEEGMSGGRKPPDAASSQGQVGNCPDPSRFG